jgi:hypothetical protein
LLDGSAASNPPQNERRNAKQPTKIMKKLLLPTLVGFLAMTLLTGCIGLSLGGGTSNHTQSPTIGQQLIDLQKAKDAGTITDAEYQAQKAKVLGNK